MRQRIDVNVLPMRRIVCLQLDAAKTSLFQRQEMNNTLRHRQGLEASSLSVQEAAIMANFSLPPSRKHHCRSQLSFGRWVELGLVPCCPHETGKPMKNKLCIWAWSRHSGSIVDMCHSPEKVFFSVVLIKYIIKSPI